jgi:hypothetical protein
MATYIGSIVIPTVNITDGYNMALYYGSNYDAFTGPDFSAGIGADVTVIETSIGGIFTYTSTVVDTNTVYTFTAESPTLVPGVLVVENTTNAYYYSTSFFLASEGVCLGCGSVEWAECEEDYTIDLGLTPSTSYNYTLTNGQTGIQYLQNSTTNGSGVTIWDTYLLPELYVSGNVFVLTATNGSEDVTFTYNGTEYSCMQITIVKQTNITD